MWALLLGVWSCAILLVILCAAFVALFVSDARRRRDGYRVLALSTTLVGSVSGLVAFLVRMYGA